MNWIKFESILKRKGFFLFTPLDVARVFSVSDTSVTFLLHRYTRQGVLTRLKKGMYIFSDTPPPDVVIANKLCEPSYISLEFALSYHSIIPEVVYSLTSVTTKSKREYSALGKVFSYRQIKKEAYTGYTLRQYGGRSFFIADPEKALVDAIYLRILDGLEPFDRMRLKALDKDKVNHYADLFRFPCLREALKNIMNV